MIISAEMKVMIAMTNEQLESCWLDFRSDSKASSIPLLSGKWQIHSIYKTFSGDPNVPWIVSLHLTASDESEDAK